jgi:undecaprenyl-diphosphatase
MEIWKAILVGIVQGFSEFLPISSSGHIALTQFLLGMREPGMLPEEDITFELVVHIGTFLSVVIYFRERLFGLLFSLWQKERTEERQMILWLFIATIPATIAFFSFRDFFEGAYNNPVLVGACLLGTGAILLLPKFFRPKKTEFGLKHAIWMGVAQALAILPGVSRSGSTITAGLLSGTKPSKAAEFSFLMFLPAIGGGTLVKAKSILEVAQGDNAGAYAAGFLAAFLSGWIAVYLVLSAIKKGKFEYFAYYCFVVGISAIIYFSVK